MDIIIKLHLERCKIYASERMFIVLVFSVIFKESLMKQFSPAFLWAAANLHAVKLLQILFVLLCFKNPEPFGIIC